MRRGRRAAAWNYPGALVLAVLLQPLAAQEISVQQIYELRTSEGNEARKWGGHVVPPRGGADCPYAPTRRQGQDLAPHPQQSREGRATRQEVTITLPG